jgi:DNA-binding MarR family transcriptional regulator
MIMVHVVTGNTRPTEIARALGVSRQAIHTTLNQMVDKGLIELAADDTDGRSKRVVITPAGQTMRIVAQEAIRIMTRALEAQLGPEVMAGLQAAFETDWGPPLNFDDLTDTSGPSPDPAIIRTA